MSSSTIEQHGRIGLRRHLRPEAVPGGPVYLVGEAPAAALHGAHVDELVALLDGTRCASSVRVEMARHGVPGEVVTSMLAELDSADLLAPYRDEAAAVPRSALAYWDAAGVDDACGAVERIGRGRVDLVTVGGAAPDRMTEALASAGVGSVAAGAGALTVALCTDYRDPALAAVDARARRDGTPWLPVKPVGGTIWVGPFLVPGDGPCWSCMVACLSANRPGPRAGTPDPPAVGLPALSSVAESVAALEVTKWLAGYRCPEQRLLRTVDGLTMESTTHAVRARPQCPACGDPGLQDRAAWAPVTLSSRPAHRDVADRSEPPAATLQRYRHLVSSLTGVASEVRQDRRAPAGFQSFRAGTRPGPAGHRTPAERRMLCWDNGGKGVTPEQAEVGALCEAIERHSGTFQGDEAIVVDTLHALGDRAIHPDSWRLHDPRQIDGRRDWNPRHAAFQQVPPPFPVDAPLPWTPVWSLTAECHRLLPTALLYYDGPGPRGLWADSNGCAAGSSREDAVLQGLLEVVERDAVALWWYNRLRVPGLAVEASDDPWVAAMPAAHRRCGREVWALDLTADLGVPVVAALSRRTAGRRDDVMMGFAAHLDPAVALRRALSEVNQMLPAVLDLGDGDLPPVPDRDLRRWLDEGTVADQPHLVAADVPRIAPRCTRGGTDLVEDVGWLRRAIERAGHEVLVLDQTRPDIGLPVVRVVVPGMRHFWARFAPGRLFDVPVRLGRLDRPTPYAALNPFPIFL